MAQRMHEIFPQAPMSTIVSVLLSTDDVGEAAMGLSDMSFSESAETAEAALLPCEHGAACQDMSNVHRDQRSHPCRHALGCRIWLRSEPVHCRRYTHAAAGTATVVAAAAKPMPKRGPLCSDDGNCVDLSTVHRSAYAHTCRFGVECRYLQRGDQAHMSRYVHPGDDTPTLHVAAAAAAEAPLLSTDAAAAAAPAPISPDVATADVTDASVLLAQRETAARDMQRVVRGYLTRKKLRSSRTHPHLSLLSWLLC